MNVQAHMSGQLSGQVPNQAGLPLTGLTQQNANPLTHQMQSLGSFWNSSSMDQEFDMARQCVKEKIHQLLRQKHAAPELQQKLPDVVRRLEEGLLRDASSKDEYMNEKTLEYRLQNVVKRINAYNHVQQQQNPHLMNSSSSMGTMMPTPGMSQTGQTHPTVSSSGDHSLTNANMVTPSTVNSGNLLPNSNGSGGVYGGSFNMSDGLMANGYQQPPLNIPVGHGTNSLVSPINTSMMSTQMVPTPGYSNSQSLPPTSIENSGGGGFPSTETALMSHQQQTKQYVGSQNSRILQSIGSQMGVGLRSNLQQKVSSYGGFPNGPVNGSLQLTGTTMQLMNGSTVSDGYLNVSSFGNSPKTSQHHFDQQRQQQMMQQGDVYGMGNVDNPGSGGLYGPSASVGSTLNNQMLSPGSMQLKPRNNHGMLPHQQSTLQMRNHMVDQAAKMSFQGPHSNREHLLQSQQQLQKFEEQQIQQQQPPFAQFVQHQNQQKQQSHQHQLLVKNNNVMRQPQLFSAVDKQGVAEHGIKSMGNSLHAQALEQYQISELHNQYQPQNNILEDQTKGTQLLNNSTNPQDSQSSFSQIPHPMQQQQFLQPCQQSIDSQNNVRNFSSGPQTDILIQGQWHTQSVDKLQQMEIHQPSNDQNIQEQFHQRITGEDEAHGPQSLPEGGSVGAGSVSSQGALICHNAATVSDKREDECRNQQRWLLFLRHAHSCPSPEGTCISGYCLPARKLCFHIQECKEENCSFPRCRQSKKIFDHHKRCRLASCPVCVPVHQFFAAHRKVQSSLPSGNAATHPNGTRRSMDIGDVPRLQLKNVMSPSGTLEGTQSSVKRRKVDQSSPSLLTVNDNTMVSVGPIIPASHSQDAQLHIGKVIEHPAAVKGEVIESKEGQLSANFGQVKSPNVSEIKKDNLEGVFAAKPTVDSILQAELPRHVKHENLVIEKENDQLKQEFKQEPTTLPTDPVVTTKSGKPKIKGVSLTELFTPEQLRDHIRGLRQWVGQSKAKAERNQAMSVTDNENSCQLCAVEKLTFEPPPIYCTPCGARIKRNNMYYTVGTGEARHYFCIPCYNDARGDTIEAEGLPIPKARLEKKKNDDEAEEWWVQCDKCERWQHQICALFNGRRNDSGQAEYTCPNCYIMEIERGDRKPLAQDAVLGAKDLPRTILSDHIEQRLARRLKQERQDRARVQGKSFEEVPGAEALVVRVVSSVDKKLEVKQRFLEIFQEENYPTEFPYKSKVILLFQKIEGVEVCLFGMYVQEFGSECQFPNQRRVYLSYLDSVKYFRPEIKTVTGEALRTFVYHEILIGYLEYCKIRGYTSCYIWACPPLKGEDYILYCHPEIQKTPKSDKLREWYLSMLRKAGKENIVVDLTNLYDHFFVSIGESKAKVTAARLPYFDGDYWPGAAEDMINQLRQEEDGRKQQKKGKTKKTITKRALKAAGHTDLSANASKDALLMHKLGETICPMKEDFIMVHLQHACTHCCHLMVSGKRWVCGQCRNFQLCDKCYNAEQKLEDRDRHPINSKEKHILNPFEINDVPADTKDKDEILESEFFDTRQAFLSLCQGNHYQYDTLRRAKHSSMMVLYHLHNPTAPAFVTTCNICQLDIEAGQGWRCEVCPDFDVCNSCYHKPGGVNHPHKLTNHPSIAERDAQNKEARQKRVQQLRIMLELLVHASQCRSPVCKYPKCRQVKGLFRHGMLCKVRATGGCVLCKRMWYLLQLHARACKESGCLVPRCKDLKEHMRRMQQQSDSRRRAAVMEMMRQRAAEVAGNSG